MRAQVKKDGVLVPKELFKGVKQVEIRKEGGRVVLLPVPASGDPIFRLGKHPVKTGLPDASELHDKYLYGGK